MTTDMTPQPPAPTRPDLVYIRSLAKWTIKLSSSTPFGQASIVETAEAVGVLCAYIERLETAGDVQHEALSLLMTETFVVDETRQSVSIGLATWRRCQAVWSDWAAIAAWCQARGK